MFEIAVGYVRTRKAPTLVRDPDETLRNHVAKPPPGGFEPPTRSFVACRAESGCVVGPMG